MLFVELLVNLKLLLPVLHFGLDVSAGSGIAKAPAHEPFSPVVRAAPAVLPIGVT